MELAAQETCHAQEYCGDGRDHDGSTRLLSPLALASAIVANASTLRTVAAARVAIANVLSGADHRLLVVVGPCSAHDSVACVEYARLLRALAPQVDDALVLVMRAYVEKPRTAVGWKGLLCDPRLDGSCRLAEGLVAARTLLRDITALGQPVAVELLSPLAAPYLADLVAWGAVGARTSESQTHRELASALDMPIGFKNGTDGSIDVALDAVRAAAHAHTFLWIDRRGRAAVHRSHGNAHGHVILRGSPGRPNFAASHVAAVAVAAAQHGLDRTPAIVVDCSHDNSGKDHRRQADAALDVAAQVRAGCRLVRGVMIESFLAEGRQNLPTSSSPSHVTEPGKSVLSRIQHGVSITDACISWEATVKLLHSLADAVRDGRLAHGT